MSILLVEQFSPHILDFLDHCYVMERGRIVYEGGPKTIKDDQDLQKKLLGVGSADQNRSRKGNEENGRR
jgi:ABC-type branched-subunit amino acid transport system ATPase component